MIESIRDELFEAWELGNESPRCYVRRLRDRQKRLLGFRLALVIPLTFVTLVIAALGLFSSFNAVSALCTVLSVVNALLWRYYRDIRLGRVNFRKQAGLNAFPKNSAMRVMRRFVPYVETKIFGSEELYLVGMERQVFPYAMASGGIYGRVIVIYAGRCVRPLLFADAATAALAAHLLEERGCPMQRPQVT